MKDGQYEVGDIVHLKSGSARLTVVGVHQNDFRQVTELDLTWMYYETQELRQARLPADAVRPADDLRTAEPSYRQYDRRTRTRGDDAYDTHVSSMGAGGM